MYLPWCFSAAVQVIKLAVDRLHFLRSDKEFQCIFIMARVFSETIDLDHPKFEDVKIRKRKRGFDYEHHDELIEKESRSPLIC